jgi:hypothetical protein
MKETKVRKPQVVARLTLTQPKNVKLIVEVPEDASFHNFYHWYRQEGRKRKVFLRTSSRNDGFGPHWRAPFEMPGLDVVAARVTGFNKSVTGVTIKILRKRKYNALLTCAPDELGNGLPQAAQTQQIIEASKGIPVQMPANYLTLQKRMDILTGAKR